MAAGSRLRAVRTGEKVAPKAPLTVTAAAASGDRRALLVAMQSRIATAVENPNTPARDLAALTKRLVEVAREIEAFDAKQREEGDDVTVADGEFDASAV